MCPSRLRARCGHAPRFGSNPRHHAAAFACSAVAIALVASVLVGCTAVTGGSPAPSVVEVGGGPVRIGSPAPVFRLDDLGGHPVSLGGYAGRPVVVNFWASWCIPCRQEFPMYRQARQTYGAKGLEILSIVYKDSVDAARGFMNTEGATWPALVDPNGSVAQAYGIVGIPDSFFVDRNGIVRAISYGPPPADMLPSYLAKIL